MGNWGDYEPMPPRSDEGLRQRLREGNHRSDRGLVVTADYCTPIPGGVICGTRMREHSRRSEGIKWCFHCRTRCEMWRVVAVPDGESYYGPTVHIECAGCGSHDGDLFPGWTREWEEE